MDWTAGAVWLADNRTCSVADGHLLKHVWSRSFSVSTKETKEEMTTLSTGRFGLLICHDAGQTSTADIVFVHGLTGARDTTWTSEKPKVFWPQELLPTDPLLKNTRVLSFGYDANIAHFWAPASQNRVGGHATNLVKSLVDLREETDTETRPVLFVVHSLGGLVFEDAMLASRNSSQTHFKELLERTHGVCFLGTPHCGADLANWASVMGNTMNLVKTVNNSLLTLLKPDSEVLRRIQHDFHAMLADRRRSGVSPVLEISCYYEELPVKGLGFIVPQHSAILLDQDPVSIYANHMDMCKFSSADDAGYRSIKADLRRWVKHIKKETASQNNTHPQNRAPGNSFDKESQAGLLPARFEMTTSSAQDWPSPGLYIGQYNGTGRIYDRGHWNIGSGSNVHF